MNYKNFGNSVGSKFKEDQSVKFFPGNTIISKISPDMEFFHYMEQVSNIIKSEQASKCLTFLPPESYHMTVIEGVCEYVRQKEYWSKNFDLHEPMEVIDEYFEKKIKNIPKLGQVTMVCTGILIDGGACLTLEPKTYADAVKLKNYRDKVREELGLDFPNHDTYYFHAGIFYGTKQPQEDDAMKLDQIFEKVNEFIKENPIEVVVKEPVLTFFDHMFFFHETRINRDYEKELRNEY